MTLPIVKWAGGKRRLLPALAAALPECFGRYYEPFLGGGALLFHLEPRTAVLGDCNADLMNAYQCVAADVEAVIRRLRRHRRAHNEAHYYRIRTRWNTRRRRELDYWRAAAFIYLNKTCFNGLWRVNRQGHFNVPMGRYTNPTICAAEQLRSASRALQGATLLAGDYAVTAADAAAGDLVYFDPPYDPRSPTASFTSYTSRGFGWNQQVALARLASELAERGCLVLASNADTQNVRELYETFQVQQVLVPRSINSNASRRGAVAELLISSF